MKKQRFTEEQIIAATNSPARAIVRERTMEGLLAATRRQTGSGRPIPQGYGAGRVGWVGEEVLEWLKERLAQRK